MIFIIYLNGLFLAVLGLVALAFLYLWRAGATLLQCGGFSCVHGFSSCSSWALEHRLNSCGTQT